ncbi:MAG: chorismate mutase [Armatimonadetes bacterium]|nr:chorismate mutase [Armatimonadota bacterium]
MNLDDLRREIDAVNMEMLRLLNRRAELARQVGEAKRRVEEEKVQNGEPVTVTPFFAPSRERQIFERLAEANAGPLSDDAVSAIFREIISQCRALEEPMRVAYWGPQGSHSHLAALRQFGTAAEFCPVVSIEAVFDQVEKRLTQYGVVPAGNSIEGVMSRTLDLLARREPRICVETYLPISYDLLSQCPVLEGVGRVYASAMPLALCSGWLAQHLPGGELIEVPSMSHAIDACLQDPEGAAIARPMDERHDGLSLLQSHIEDDPRTKGRFFTIGFNPPERSGRDKTSLLITVHHQPGSMVRALDVFSRHGVNILFIQSRHALRRPNVYRIFVDLQGYLDDTDIAEALAEMRRERILYEVLGSYPDALPPVDEPTD